MGVLLPFLPSRTESNSIPKEKITASTPSISTGTYSLSCKSSTPRIYIAVASWQVESGRWTDRSEADRDLSMRLHAVYSIEKAAVPAAVQDLPEVVWFMERLGFTYSTIDRTSNLP